MPVEPFHKVTQVIQWLGLCINNSGCVSGSRVIGEQQDIGSTWHWLDWGCLFCSVHWDISVCIALLVHIAVFPIAKLEIRMRQHITGNTLCEKTFLHWQHLLLTPTPYHLTTVLQGCKGVIRYCNCQSTAKYPCGFSLGIIKMKHNSWAREVRAPHKCETIRVETILKWNCSILCEEAEEARKYSEFYPFQIHLQSQSK